MSQYQLFDAFQDIIFVVDGDWKLFYGNTMACLLIEVTPRRLSSGKPLAQFMEFASPITDESGIGAIEELTHAREVTFTLPGSGKTGWVQVVMQPVPASMAQPEDGKRWIISMRDTTLERTLHLKYRGELDQKESVIKDLQEARKALEEYSSLLEKKVEERTIELREANRLQKTILDSLGQGILVFDKNGVCLPIFSKICLRMLQGEPTGQPIEKILGFAGSEAEGFTQWREAVFDQLLDFEDMVPLAPSRLTNANGLELHFDYYPMQDANHQLQGVVVVATDKTREVAALKKAEEERLLVGKVTQVARNRDAFRLFVSEATRLLSGLQSSGDLDLEDITRRLHTLKGGSASFSLMAIADACHELENNVKIMNAPESRDQLNSLLAEKSREVLTLLDAAIHDLAELLGPSVADLDNQTIELASEQVKAWAQGLFDASRDAKWEGVRHVAGQLWREATEKPVGPTVLHLSASLKGLAASMGKHLEAFDVVGADTKVSAEKMQGLFASLVHAFRNCIYHGLETTDDRVKAGKSAGGRVFAKFTKSVSLDHPSLRIEIGDDGRGVDPARIRKKLRDIGLVDLAAKGDHEVIQAILRDDFSTSTEINLVAGRGVGLSAIAAEVVKLGGKIEVMSELGRGMSLVIEVPVPNEQAAVEHLKSA